MKKQNIIAEGHCGINVELTIVDQYRLADELSIIDKADAEMKKLNEWEQARNAVGRNGEDWKRKRELQDEYERKNPRPEPTVTPDRLNMAHANIIKFARKFAIEGDRVSNIFDE